MRSMVNRAELERWTRDTGFDPDLLERVYHLSRILEELKDSGILENGLSLKGGTALNLLYLDLPRLSVDIDLNYTGNIEKKGMEYDRKIIEGSIKDIGMKMGYDTIEKGSSYIITRMKLSFTRLSGIRDHVKIEINFLDRMPLGPIIKKDIRQVLPFLEPMSIPTYGITELCSQKSVACIMRRLPRDIFDMAELSKIGLELDKLRKYSAVHYCMHAFDEKIDLSFFDNIPIKSFDQSLRPFLRYRIDHSELLERSRIFVEDIFDYDEEISDFIHDYYLHGKIQDDFLGSSIHLKRSPALLFNLKKKASSGK